LIHRSDFAPTLAVGIAEEQVAGKRHPVSQLAAQKGVKGQAQLLAHEVETGKLDGGMQLRAVIVQGGGGVANLESQRLQLKGIVPDEVRLQSQDSLLRTFTP